MQTQFWEIKETEASGLSLGNQEGLTNGGLSSLGPKKGVCLCVPILLAVYWFFSYKVWGCLHVNSQVLGLAQTVKFPPKLVSTFWSKLNYTTALPYRSPSFDPPMKTAEAGASLKSFRAVFIWCVYMLHTRY